MGCGSSRTIDVDVYRPPPSSFAVFDVAGIQEPWLKPDVDQDPYNNSDDKTTAVVVSAATPTVLEKLKAVDDAPRSWDEVSSEVLQYLTADSTPAVVVKPKPTPSPEKNKKGLQSSIRTVEEVESRIKNGGGGGEVGKTVKTVVQREVPKSLKDNIFIVRDRLEREKDGNTTNFVSRNALTEFPEICPPGGGDAVVLYTTSIGGVRRTQMDCHRLRQILEFHQVVVDERDVALDAGFLSEIKELLGEETAALPKLFVKGRYIGGAEEAVGLNETGRLSRILNWAAVERGIGRLGCGGCGGARFVPCVNCGGSCKVVGAGGEKERCGECNENGLLRCPLCTDDAQKPH